MAAKDKLHVVAVSHLDTQWWWDIQTTIKECIPSTFLGTFEQFEKYPDYVFSWEGANRYKLLEEYYPELYEKLLDYVTAGRWFPAGSSLEGGDVNIPSPEALLRNLLYGNRWFEQNLGMRSVDVFLPDCFGFGAVLPTVAAHCGLTGFSTQKLGWGSAVPVPFSIGVWKGVDGRGLVSALNPGSYVSDIDHDLSYDPGYMDVCSTDVPGTMDSIGYRYFGTGDQGGPAPDKSVEWLQKSIESDGPVEVQSVRSDQLFRDLSPEQVASLPTYQGELVLTTHGTGSYTSQALMKRLNRKNEQLADAAERANVAAAWLGAVGYPADKLTDAWERFLVHHFHDDLTGTGIPEIYQFSWNDEYLAQNRLATALVHGVGGVASRLDTQVTGIPLVVFNPLSLQRKDVVEAVVRYPDGHPPAEHPVVRSVDFGLSWGGGIVPTQEIERGADWVRLLFLDSFQADAIALYEVGSGGEPAPNPALSVSTQQLENERYRVSLDGDGNVVSVFDKDFKFELLSAPLRLAMYDDWSGVWPAWEILYKDISVPPREVVSGPAEIRVIENGPVRVAVEVVRKQAGSEFIERHRLVAGGQRFETETIIRWNTMGTLLKAEYPLAAKSKKAVYDLGVGTISRGNNTEKMYEVPAQQWADLTDELSGNWGVAVLNDCKYGWDKPDDSTLRLTLLHLPFQFIMSVRYGQDTMDIGEHRILSAIYSHNKDWRTGVSAEAARLNQPLLAFQTDRHAGAEDPSEGFPFLFPVGVGNCPGGGSDFLFTGDGPPLVRAIKKAEDSDEIIVRVAEPFGQKREYLCLRFGESIVAAREVNGMEDEVGPVVIDDGLLRFDLAPYQLRTFAVTPAPPSGLYGPPRPDRAGGEPLSADSRFVSLPFNVDVVSPNDARGDGKFANVKDVPFAIPAEQWPEEWVDDGIRYELGPPGNGKLNAVSAAGQVIPIDPQAGERLYILAAADKDRDVTFKVGDMEVPVSVQGFTGFIGQWTGRVKDGKVLLDPAEFLPPYLKLDPVAWYSTHRHRPDRDDPYMFTYLYRYVLPIPAGATSVTLPDSPGVVIAAMTLAADPAASTVAATPLHDGFDVLAVPMVPGYVEPEQEVPEPPVEEALGDDVSSLPAATNGCSGCVTGPASDGTSRSLRILLAGALLLLAARSARRGSGRSRFPSQPRANELVR